MNASRKSIKSDLAKLDALQDTDINYSDIPELDDSFFNRATVEWPKEKKTITIRLDADVIDWLKHQGKGYQTRINAVLRAYMKHAAKRD
ncbi:MAG: BrnA antitoxin family protein [Gammaproteobacteria bacterium]